MRHGDTARVGSRETSATGAPRESDIQREIRLAAGRAVPGCVLWRNSTGVATHARDLMRDIASTIDLLVRGRVADAIAALRALVRSDKRVVRYGLCPGSSDLIGLLRVGPLAVFLAVEVKTTTGRLSPEQRMFGELVERTGGVFIVARSVDDFVAQATAARARLEATLAHPEHPEATA